jgi:hypothetical protein
MHPRPFPRAGGLNIQRVCCRGGGEKVSKESEEDGIDDDGDESDAEYSSRNFILSRGRQNEVGR